VSEASEDALHMRRALRAARRGRPSPNPHVGAVVVRGQEVVSVGHHAQVGEDHAEVVALRKAGEAARGATLYVTFEPCNHHGRTPPCTEAILEAGIRRVVVGCADPAPHVPGASERLRAAGLEVEIGVLGGEAKALVADFTKLITTGMPLVTLKAALTLDGKMATRSGDSKWITGELARREAHRMRAHADAVMIGVGTLLADDPLLTVRHVRGRDPLRVLLDSRLRSPLEAKMLSGEGGGTLVYHAEGADPARIEALRQRGVQLACVSAARASQGGAGGLALDEVLADLGRRGVMRLMVEGGASLHGALLAEGLVDRLAFFLAPKLLADASAQGISTGVGVLEIASAARLNESRVRRFGDDLLIEGELDTGGLSARQLSKQER